MLGFPNIRVVIVDRACSKGLLPTKRKVSKQVSLAFITPLASEEHLHPNRKSKIKHRSKNNV
jgi:hypothetical protein